MDDALLAEQSYFYHITVVFFFFSFFISYFTWVFIQVLSPVLPWSPGPECTEQFDGRGGFSLLIMFRASHKQWEVAILILINTSALIKFGIVEMDNWLNLNKRPCWDSIRDPFASNCKANPWSAGLPYLYGSFFSSTCLWNMPDEVKKILIIKHFVSNISLVLAILWNLKF